MQIRWRKLLAKALVVTTILMAGVGDFAITSVFSAAPPDENYDDDPGYSNSDEQFTNDGITYTLTGLALPTEVIHDGVGSGGSSLGDDGGDYYISFFANTVKIEAENGGYFKLNGFAMDVYADGAMTITPDGGTPLTRNCNGSIVVENVNTSANTDFQYITSVTFSGTNMLLKLDDLDFATAVPPTYSVTYNSNGSTGGSVPTDGNSYISGDTVTVAGNTGSLAKTGYSFAGWNTAANGSGTSRTPGSTFLMGSSNVTLYAQWTPNNYTVTYNGNINTGGSVPTDGNSYHITDTVTVLGNTGSLTKTGYTFAGWNTAANGSGNSYSGGNTFAMGSSNVTLYAQWTENTYTVTYNGNSNTGGAVPTDATSYHNGDTATVLGNTGTLSRTGYTFAGWNTAANGSGTSYNPSDTFSITLSNVTLYAQWTAVDYTVTYNGNTNTGGSVPTDGNSYHITDTVTVLGNTGSLVKTGYTFTGWNTAANGSGSSYSGGNTFAMGSSNVTLYAQWSENTYTVTYNGNGNTGGAVPTDATSYHNGDTATVLGNTGSLVRAGYTFAGWNTAANGSGISYTGGDTFAITTSNVGLYAQWTAVNYFVTYNGNTNTGGSVPVDGNTYNITNTVTVLGNTGGLVKTGYTFAGWNTAANGSGSSYSGGNTFAMGSGNVTLYAQWTENTYSVTYNGNGNTGGSVPTDATSYHNGDTATALGNTGVLVKSGYTFAGWNTAANGSGNAYNPADSFAIGTSNVTLYAQWTANNYTVTYNGNTNTGGSVPVDGNTYHITDTVTVQDNTGNLVKTGYTFAGWNTLANGTGTNYSSGAAFAMGSSNVTLYAKWTEDTYSVTYNGNGSTGGSVPTDATAYHNGDTVTVLGNTGSLVKAGYTFAGWNTASNGSGTSYSAGNTFAMGANAVTLYAQWTLSNLSVTYDGNGHSGGTVPIDGNTYHITDSVTVLGNTGSLNKTGYSFGGWNTNASGTGTTYSAGNSFTMGGSNVILYAKWNTEGSSGSGNGGSSNTPPVEGETGGANLIVNGEEQVAGTATTVVEGDQQVTKVVVDPERIESLLAEEGNGALVVIPVNNASDVVVGQLTGQMVKNLENREAVVEVKTPEASYTLPAQQIDIDAISSQFGQSVALRDIVVSIEISTPPDQTIQFVENVAQAGTFTIVAPPLQFNVTCTYGRETITVNAFNAYIERTIAVPAGIDPARITTGVVIGADGTVRHVPTRIIVIDGKYYAQINSLTNSTYALVYHAVTFEDMEYHWAKAAVNDMASRMVVKGVDSLRFEPERPITRAEFAAVLMRAMGLDHKEGGEPFADVAATDWYQNAVATASSLEILKGYEDGTFRPNNGIKREEAMAMIATALRIAGKDVALTREDAFNTLQEYRDGETVSDWAQMAVATCIETGIVQGSNESLNPQNAISRAESAALIQRMLRIAGLI